ncbi:MAG: NDP-hexose 2,3-dehydratase family protein [Vicinamibacterales bacterium]
MLSEAARASSNAAGVMRWLAATNEAHPLRVERVPFSALESWHFQPRPLRLAHRSGQFFSIEGARIETDFGPLRCWDQPVINQPEIGILGFLVRWVDGAPELLMQAKIEPGNVNGAQLSPTLQATRSNYTRVHRGARPAFLEYFTGEAPGRVLIDQLQSEQGSRFLGKRNRNMVVEPLDEPAVDDRFRWMPLAQVKGLLHVDNVVNMDARSVLSCIPLSMDRRPAAPAAPFTAALRESATARTSWHATTDILNALTRLRAGYDRAVARIGLDRLKGWDVSPAAICRPDDRYFSVIAARVEIGNREVTRWEQPLLYHRGEGLNGMVTQRIDGVLHFLMRACMYAGSRETFELGPTASRSDYLRESERGDVPAFLRLFAQPDPSWVRFSSVQSEEGGRFYHYQNRYMILELPPDEITRVPEGYLWMTLAQIESLLPHGYFNIEARNLLACLQTA